MGSIFPMPYLTFFAGYCLVLLVDRVFAGHYSHNHDRLAAGGSPCEEHPINPQVCHDVNHQHHNQLEIVDFEDNEGAVKDTHNRNNEGIIMIMPMVDEDRSCPIDMEKKAP